MIVCTKALRFRGQSRQEQSGQGRRLFPTLILVANSTFEGTFYLSQASKVVDIPHREEKKDFFVYLSPLFEFATNINVLTGPVF